jgi:hypothetical protein
MYEEELGESLIRDEDFFPTQVNLSMTEDSEESLSEESSYSENQEVPKNTPTPRKRRREQVEAQTPSKTQKRELVEPVQPQRLKEGQHYSLARFLLDLTLSHLLPERICFLT